MEVRMTLYVSCDVNNPKRRIECALQEIAFEEAVEALGLETDGDGDYESFTITALAEANGNAAEFLDRFLPHLTSKDDFTLYYDTEGPPYALAHYEGRVKMEPNE